jgi:hypothetical protein
MRVHSLGPSTKTLSPATAADRRIIPTAGGIHPLDARGAGPGHSGSLGAGRGAP